MTWILVIPNLTSKKEKKTALGVHFRDENL